jgi:DNA-binding transcriptional regulator YiaG
MKTGPKPRPIEERFWEKVNTDGPVPEHRSELGPCWQWIGGQYHDGYGYFTIRISGKPIMFRAHRHAYEMTGGTISDGLLVLHACDNPLCVRNDTEGWYELDGILHPMRGHLWLGTQEDNMRDKTIKGRQTHGDNHYMHQGTPHEFAHERRTNVAKLTGDQVREIRRRYEAGGVTQAALGAEFGVTNKAISKVVRGERWPHIE